MKTSVYKKAKLEIFERAAAGEITESQRDTLLTMLEDKKDASDLSDTDIKNFFDALEEKYPDLEDDIEKLLKKIEKSSGDDDSDDEKDDDKDENEEQEVSEAARDLYRLIDNLR